MSQFKLLYIHPLFIPEVLYIPICLNLNNSSIKSDSFSATLYIPICLNLNAKVKKNKDGIVISLHSNMSQFKRKFP